MADPARPTVPAAEGVPATKPPPFDGEPTAKPTAGAAKTNDGASVIRSRAEQWGIFDKGGAKALEPDSFKELDDGKEYNVPRYPVEGGGFQSFNKVELPQELGLDVVKGGKDAAKAAFLNTVATMAGSVDLFTVVTPGRTYRNMNLVRYAQHRTADAGAALLTIQLRFCEARITAKAGFTDVKAPSAADNANGGSVQPTAPSATQTPAGAPK